MDDIREQIRAGFDALRDRADERFEDAKQASDQRHGENVARLMRIETEVRETNGRVTRTEEQLRLLFGRFGRADGQTEAITLDRLKWYLICVGGGFLACISLLKLMGKL